MQFKRGSIRAWEKSGEEKFGKLVTSLLREGKTDQIEKAATDENLRKKLYEKYKIKD